MTDTEETLVNAYLGKKELYESARRQRLVLEEEVLVKKQQENQYLAEAQAYAKELGLTFAGH